MPVTNRDAWCAAEVVEAYWRQQHEERVFRGQKGGGWLGWSTAYHWTDSKLRVHAFYCMLGVSLLQYLHRRAQTAWPEPTLEGLREELRQVQQIELLYAGEPNGARPRLAAVAPIQSLAQTRLVAALGIERLLLEPAAENAG